MVGSDDRRVDKNAEIGRGLFDFLKGRWCDVEAAFDIERQGHSHIDFIGVCVRFADEKEAIILHRNDAGVARAGCDGWGIQRGMLRRVCAGVIARVILVDGASLPR